MYDHLGIVTADLSVARAFYDACLAPLGFRCLQDNSVSANEGWLVYGSEPDKPFFVVAGGRPGFWPEDAKPATSPMHIAFQAADRAAVNQFHEQGLQHGGSDNGPPGDRPSNTPYYAAYLIDPDGNNVEAGFRGTDKDGR